MIDAIAGGDLPTPNQMRNFYAAERAAWSARRMREASRAVVTGNIALLASLLGITLTVIHSAWLDNVGPFVACALTVGGLATAFLSVRWAKRSHDRSPVSVLDRREEAARTIRPRRSAIAILICIQVVSVVGWTLAFRHLSQAGIFALLAIGPMIAIGYFVWRFASFRFWEDLLFAIAVALAYLPFFLRDYTAVAFLSVPIIMFGTASLHARWSTWSRSLGDQEVQP